MKEITFRAWDKDNNQMRYIDIMWFSEADLPFFNYDLMQFTNLYDKNGKKIYEGDIIRYTVNGRTETLQVFFEDGMFKTSLSTLKAVHRICEVVGNKFEHPHLLERSEV